MTITSAEIAATAERQRAFRPRFARIRVACGYSGLGRSSLYLEAARHPGLFRKWNGLAGKTLVDLDILDVILSALPPAEITPLPPTGTKPSASRRRHSGRKTA
jgi:hypothetical protein